MTVKLVWCSTEADVHAANPSLSNAAATWAGWAVTAVTAKFYRSQSDTVRSSPHSTKLLANKPASLGTTCCVKSTPADLRNGTSNVMFLKVKLWICFHFEFFMHFNEVTKRPIPTTSRNPQSSYTRASLRLWCGMRRPMPVVQWPPRRRGEQPPPLALISFTKRSL